MYNPAWRNYLSNDSFDDVITFNLFLRRFDTIISSYLLRFGLCFCTACL